MRTLFDGPDVTTADAVRLEGQLGRVFDYMKDGIWRSLDNIATHVQGSEAGVSARLRDLRKPRFGAHTVERSRFGPASGIWYYRLIPRASGTSKLPANAVAPGCQAGNNVADEVLKPGARGISNV